MDYVQGNNPAVDYFGSGKDGFKDRNLPTVPVGTTASAADWNALWGELVQGLIEYAGLTPSAADLTQVRQAIEVLIDNRRRFWTLASSDYDDVAFDVGNQDATPRGIAFNNAGTKMYILGGTNVGIYQYSLSTAWNISTANYDGVFKNVSSQDSTPTDIFFKPDGLKMYMTGSTNDRVYQYTLGAAWDLSTLSYDSIFYSVSIHTSSPQGLFFKGDGTKMYVLATNDPDVYNLSTPWDLTTATWVSPAAPTLHDTGTYALVFSPDGTRCFITGCNTGVIDQYIVKTAWDIGTLVYDKSQCAVDTTPEGLTFKPDGSKMYVAGSADAIIYQFTTVTML